MIEATPKVLTTVSSLIDKMESYVCDNRSSRNVAERWLCAHLQITLPLLRQVRNGNVDPQWKTQIDGFRLGEIDKAKQEKQQEIDRLNREAEALTRT